MTSDPNGLMVSLSLYMPWGGSRGGAGTTLTDYGFNGQRSMEGSIGLQYFNARWYDSSLGRWTQPDTIIPQASQGVIAWDRFAYANSSPLKYNDPSGHDADCSIMDYTCKQEVASEKASSEITNNQGGDNNDKQEDHNYHYKFDLKDSLKNMLPNTSPTYLSGLGLLADRISLGLDIVDEAIVLGFVGVGAVGGLTFEGNPVTGGAGAVAGWIVGEANPVTQGIMGVGNGVAAVGWALNAGADALSGNTNLNVNLSLSNQTISVNGNWSISSNTVESTYLTSAGLSTKIVELSMIFQGASVAIDQGVLPARNYSGNFNVDFP